MKKYLSGLAAIILALSLNSFMAHTEKDLKSAENLYWFQVLPGQGANPSFLDNQVTLIGQSASSPSGTNCTGTGKKCVVGFKQSQLIAPAFTHLDDQMGSNPQIPETTGKERSAL
ncbi:MAG TPA: hypothetical protein PLL71_03205 [Agriterribacter sp.]|nr:hypothetical protein [Agriterribacter sp.]HRQ49440.1 hypothetical protein [Agriterribacter sp.]